MSRVHARDGRATPRRARDRLLEPLFLRLEHDHLTRDPLDHLEHERFEIESVDPMKWE